MLEIKVDIVPFGLENKRRQISLLKIWNTGDGDQWVGKYKYKLITDSNEFDGRIYKFSREDGALALIYKVIQQLKRKKVIK